jgi:hypothetical protein
MSPRRFPPALHYGMTVVPRDLTLATLASVNGWAVPAKSTQSEAAQILAQYLTQRQVHAGWSSVQPAPADTRGRRAGVPSATPRSRKHLVPRLDASTSHMAQFLDQQLNLLAHNPAQTPEVLYAKIQAEVLAPTSPASGAWGRAHARIGTLPAPKTDASTQLRGTLTRLSLPRRADLGEQSAPRS